MDQWKDERYSIHCPLCRVLYSVKVQYMYTLLHCAVLIIIIIRNISVTCAFLGLSHQCSCVNPPSDSYLLATHHC